MVVRDLAAARVFSDPLLRRLLLWFSVAPRSVGEAAAAIGMDIRRMHYHVRRLAERGLLAETGIRRRAGRPIKLYRAAAGSFFIPFDAAETAFGDSLSAELREALVNEQARSDGGMLFRATRAGSVRGRIVIDNRRRGAGAELWRLLRLSPAQADELAADLKALLNRYQRQSGGERGRTYLVHAALAPRRDGLHLVDNP